MIYCNLDESVIIKCYKKNYDSTLFMGEEHIHYCNTIQNIHLFKKSGIPSGVTFLLEEMKSQSPLYMIYTFHLRFLFPIRSVQTNQKIKNLFKQKITE